MINFKDMKELIKEQTNQINKIRKLLDDLEENQRILNEKMDKIQFSLYDNESCSVSDIESCENESIGSMASTNFGDLDDVNDELDFKNMNISENLYIALGLSQIERKRNSDTEEQEWRPPSKSGLNNSSRLV